MSSKRKKSEVTFFFIGQNYIRHKYNTVELYNASPMGASVNCIRLYYIKYYKVKNKAGYIKKIKVRVDK